MELKQNGGKFGTMTGHEKRMNKQDLRSYRQDEHTTHAMIPGLSHVQSVGSLPTKRVGQALSPAKPMPSPQIKATKLNAFKTRNGSHQPSQSMGQLPAISQPQPRPMTNLYSSYLGSQASNRLSKNEEAALAFESAVDRSQHNPLTNPLGGAEDNPYISRQKKMILSRMAMS